MEMGVAAQERLQVFLTNSLEEFNPNAGTLFGNALSQEANAASSIKKEAPNMVVMLGNPPYSGESKNKGKWIMDLMEDYKKEPGGVKPLQERKIWLNDDYCKFIRLGQYYVDRNHEGILAYICNNGFLDNPTFRGMRWNLLQSFDKVLLLSAKNIFPRSLLGQKKRLVLLVESAARCNFVYLNLQRCAKLQLLADSRNTSRY